MSVAKFIIALLNCSLLFQLLLLTYSLITRLVAGIVMWLTSSLIDMRYLLDSIFILLVIFYCIYFIEDVHILVFWCKTCTSGRARPLWTCLWNVTTVYEKNDKLLDSLRVIIIALFSFLFRYCIFSWLISISILFIGDVLSIYSVDMYNVQTRLKSEDSDWY